MDNGRKPRMAMDIDRKHAPGTTVLPGAAGCKSLAVEAGRRSGHDPSELGRSSLAREMIEGKSAKQC
jgi:hypothetical protein